MVRRLCYLGCIAGLLLSGSGQGLTQNALPDAPQTIVRPQPDAQGIYHVGDGVSAPKLIFQVEPGISQAARKRKISAVRQYRFEPGQYQGRAVPVRVTIDVDFQIFYVAS